jgi:hypothetical protein
MRFLVDQPLGGLAKWLRFCGFDAAVRRLSPPLPSPAPETYLLTSRPSLKKPDRPDVLVLVGAHPRQQLQEVLERLAISPDRHKVLTRCSRCNETLAPVGRDEVQGRVPEHVYHHHEEFYECPRCRRLFWPGSHLKGIAGTLEKNLPQL